MEAFGTSPWGLGIHPDRFWHLSSRELRARERIWERAHRDQRFQWACVMEGLYLEAKKLDGSKFSRYDWLPASDRPTGVGLAITTGEWKTVEEAHALMRHQDTRTQMSAIRQMLGFAAGYNEVKSSG